MPYVSLEGVTVSEFDFIDVREVIYPTGAAPITVKSLLFASGLDRRSIKQALIQAIRRPSPIKKSPTLTCHHDGIVRRWVPV